MCLLHFCIRIIADVYLTFPALRIYFSSFVHFSGYFSKMLSWERMTCIVFYNNLFVSFLSGPTYQTSASKRCHAYYCLRWITNCTLYFKSALTGNRMQDRIGKRKLWFFAHFLRPTMLTPLDQRRLLPWNKDAHSHGTRTLTSLDEKRSLPLNNHGPSPWTKDSHSLWLRTLTPLDQGR